MEYNPNRLQFVHHEECFQTSDEAKQYVSKELDKTIRPALYGEPMILKYGDPLEPNVILAIGSLGDGTTPSITNRTYFIDTASIEQNVEEIEKKYSLSTKDTDTISLNLIKETSGQTLSADVKLAEKRIFDKTETQTILIKDENGLFVNVDLTYNKDENTLTFSVNGENKDFELPKEKYVVSGTYDTKTECIILELNDGSKVSIDVKKLIGEWTVEGEATNTPIVLTLTHVKYEEEPHGEDEYQDVLHADVRIADEDTKPFNILKKTTDGRYLYVDGNAKNIKYLKNGNFVSVQDAIDGIDTNVSSSDGNIIYKKQDGIFANTDLTYDVAENTLIFTHTTSDGSKESKSMKLNNASLLEDVSYDPLREVIILRFKTSTGEITTVEIPVSAIITEWDVDNTNTNVTLVKNRSVSGTDKLSANLDVEKIIGSTNTNIRLTKLDSNKIVASLNINDIIDNSASTVLLQNIDNKINASVQIAQNVPDNILKVDGSNSSLFVVGNASNIKCIYNSKTTNTQEALNDIGPVIETLKERTTSGSEELIEIRELISELTVRIENLENELKRVDAKATLVDDDENDYIKHTFTVNSAKSGYTYVHTELEEDLSRDPDSGSQIDF